MPKTVQIRDIDDETYASLSRKAAAAGFSVPELLRREARRIARLPSVHEWLERTRRRPSSINGDEIVEALDEVRGDWPDAGR